MGLIFEQYGVQRAVQKCMALFVCRKRKGGSDGDPFVSPAEGKKAGPKLPRAENKRQATNNMNPWGPEGKCGGIKGGKP